MQDFFVLSQMFPGLTSHRKLGPSNLMIMDSGWKGCSKIPAVCRDACLCRYQQRNPQLRKPLNSKQVQCIPASCETLDHTLNLN